MKEEINYLHDFQDNKLIEKCDVVFVFILDALPRVSLKGCIPRYTCCLIFSFYDPKVNACELTSALNIMVVKFVLPIGYFAFSNRH